MIDSQKVLYSAGANDECYTPAYGVRPILKYIPKDWVVWCPFDTEESEYVKLIRANGNKDLQLLMFDKRIKFLNNGEVQNKITFSSAYYCWNFLPKQIIMEKLECK